MSAYSGAAISLATDGLSKLAGPSGTVGLVPAQRKHRGTLGGSFPNRKIPALVQAGARLKLVYDLTLLLVIIITADLVYPKYGWTNVNQEMIAVRPAAMRIGTGRRRRP